MLQEPRLNGEISGPDRRPVSEGIRQQGLRVEPAIAGRGNNRSSRYLSDPMQATSIAAHFVGTGFYGFPNPSHELLLNQIAELKSAFANQPSRASVAGTPPDGKRETNKGRKDSSLARELGPSQIFKLPLERATSGSKPEAR